ncbi:OmpA family protein [Aquimarina addita]|uniref:OmpA family protein n=1 Tax=Aquimarina addita TaxID=870485 RepID=A0ABP6UNW1_9FLAO
MGYTTILRIKKNAVLLLLFITFIGCDTLKKAELGAIVGGVAGAAAGAVIGNNVGDGNSELGAMIGGAVGATAGAMIGNRMDQQAKKIEEEIPSVEVEVVEEEIYMVFDQSNGVFFDSGKSVLNDTTKETMRKLSNVLIEYPTTKILIAGHTDSQGKEESNLKLSKERAESVRDYLIGQGVEEGRFTVEYYGESNPKATNDTPEGREKNRRVEVKISPNAVKVQSDDN